ncbi:hypothetical protein CDD82_5860 [Ophiocordyceps australis]|uniref:Class E vacuolar protein-sorting machinery protein HSE1 n=1 Tax=Ophiocordyceps australis TaxID=1399860 RepID=A0A2C5YSY8_9HYPO|nr:hypothetical protein CDD82_5860 [Ophiocordyceps australis]
MNGSASPAPSGPAGLYVRALFDYHADDGTSLSFHHGDIIEVVTRLESGWWDGIINGVRGWFPSNYCELISAPDGSLAKDYNASAVDGSRDTAQANNSAHDNLDQDEGLGAIKLNTLPIEGTDTEDYQSGTDFWIPQATSDGRLYYFNTMTGDRRAELPMESPVSSAETGPRDRNNVKVLDKSRLPIELMASGFTQDEDDKSTTSVSEAEDEALTRSFKGYTVRVPPPPAHFLI